jgi:phage-related protein
MPVGTAVWELRVRAGGAYRLLYIATFAEAVYVLHAFEKRSRKTARPDIELARARLQSLMRERKGQ